jgi:hypothetical protein
MVLVSFHLISLFFNKHVSLSFEFCLTAPMHLIVSIVDGV